MRTGTTLSAAACRIVAAVACLLFSVPLAHSAEIVIYGFEDSLDNWQIPEWAQVSDDYVLNAISVNGEFHQEGLRSLMLETAFPGGRWTGAYVERLPDVTDWTPFGRLSADVFIPEYAPEGLEARIILTVGEDWSWTEMNHAVPLKKGAWTTLTVNLKPGSMDWSFFPNDSFRQSVRKVGIRIESNGSPEYFGKVFIDNIRLSE